MYDAALDHPIYTSLQGRHAPLALAQDGVCRYPAEVAPFLGVPASGEASPAALEALVPEGDTVYLLGVAPRVDARWSLKDYAPLAQMVRETPIPVPDGPDMVALEDAHREDVLALTALVYPHYFRPRTMALGQYFGIYREGRLAAMIGERLGGGATREMSAICTHPEFLGRGYAQRLTAMLTNATLAAGRVPYLHVSHENLRAKALYLRMGYRLRRDIGFWSLRRA